MRQPHSRYSIVKVLTLQPNTLRPHWPARRPQQQHPVPVGPVTADTPGQQFRESPGRDDPDVKNLKPSKETELTAMRVVMEHERTQGRQVQDVSAKNLGYDVTSLDTRTGDLKLIEVKGLAAETGTILLSPNEHRVAEDRPECFWLYVVTNCAGQPVLQEPILNPARFEWHEVSKIQHYWLQVDAMTKPIGNRSQTDSV